MPFLKEGEIRRWKKCSEHLGQCVIIIELFSMELYTCEQE
jgi:hypothetical protein